MSTSRHYQYLATLTGSFSLLSAGINLGWSSPYLPEILNGTYSGLSMTGDEGSWCAVMPLVGAPIGSLCTALFVDHIGPKKIALLTAPLTLAMFILLAVAKTPLLVFISRFLVGSVEGALYTALPMYLGEIAEPAIRGILTTSVPLAATLGILLINVMGFYLSIFTSALISCAVPIIHLFTFVWMPDSPYYLIKKGRPEEAKKSLQILRGTRYDIKPEFESLCAAVARQESNRKAKLSDLFTGKSNLRALVIFLILNTTKKFSGKNPFMFYMASIFQKADGVLDPKSSVIICVCIEAVATVLALFCVDRMGRKKIVIASTLGCAFALGSIGLYFFMQQQGFRDLEYFEWLPLVGLVIYTVFYAFGLNLAPTVYVGELFPTSVKGAALGICDTISILNGTITTKLFQLMWDYCGNFVPMWFFAGSCIFGLILIVLYVPETKNKSLEEIQLYLKQGTKNKSSCEVSANCEKRV